MVNAVSGGAQPAPVKKPEEKKEEKQPESQTPAAPQAPVEKPNTGNTGSADQDIPKDGLDPKAAFQVSQRLNTKSTGGDGKSQKGGEPGGQEDAADAVWTIGGLGDVNEAVGELFGTGKKFSNEKDAGSGKKAGTDKPADKNEKDTKASQEAAEDLLNGLDGKEPKAGGKDGDSAGKGDSATGASKPDTKAGKGEDKKGDEKPKETPITKDSALGYAYANFDMFDTGAGIGSKDKLFSIKDLDALADSNIKEVADNAKMLIKEDIVGEIGGKDGKISKDDIDGYFEENFNVSDTYKNIKIDEDSFTKDELKTFNKHLGLMARDPDGQKLLEATNNREGGFTLRKDKEAANERGAAAYVSGSKSELVVASVRDDGGYLSLLTHEMTHAATPDEAGLSSEESLASVLGHRIWSRHYGDHDFTKDNGETVTFDGSTEAEEMVFIEELKKRGDGKPEDYVASYGDHLRSLGFEFDFDTNVSAIDDEKTVYVYPEGKPEEGSKEDEHDHDH